MHFKIRYGLQYVSISIKKMHRIVYRKFLTTMSMRTPFTNIEKEVEDMHHFIQPTHFCPKPIFSVTSKRKLQLT